MVGKMDNLDTNFKPSNRSDKNTDNFYTPGWLIDQINYFYEGCIDLDPCADPLKRIPARKHYCFQANGLEQEWKGNIFCNPPYSKTSHSDIGKWVNKAVKACEEGNETLLLLPVSLDTKWGQQILSVNQFGQHCRIVFFRRRIKFLNSDYLESGKSGRFASMLVYFGRQREVKFRKIFSLFGMVI